jgi:hypothetical protein
MHELALTIVATHPCPSYANGERLRHLSAPALLYLAPTLPWPFLVLPLALALPAWATAMAKPSSYRRCSLPSLTSHPRVPLRLPHRAPQPPCGRPCQPPAPTASCRPIAVIAFVALLLRHCCLQP